MARAKGFYVIGVNTQKFFNGENNTDFFDTYIERYNFGRDFGSYKAGFKYIFKRKYHKQCPRLIMLNDSVYYESTRSVKFLDGLANTTVEVLGATENYEIEHHLGSFCISIDGRIIRHKKFIKYWDHYSNSDVRPVVIKRGEMALSKCLRLIAKSPEDFRALYDVVFIAKTLQENHELSGVALEMTRRGDKIPWTRVDPQKIWDEFIKQYYFSNINFYQHKKIKLSNDMINFCSYFDLNEVKNFFETHLKIQDKNLLKNMKTFVCSSLIRVFRVGSQIHQNNAILLHLGMPLIKLDGFFRGNFSETDVLALCSQLQEDEATELKRLLFSKSFAGETLLGWKFYMVMSGIL